MRARSQAAAERQLRELLGERSWCVAVPGNYDPAGCRVDHQPDGLVELDERGDLAGAPPKRPGHIGRCIAP